MAKKPVKHKRTKRVNVVEQEPLEVLVYDPIQKEKVVAEFYHEAVQWYGVKLYRVYHPAFKEREDGSRLVSGFKVLGTFDPTEAN